MTAGIPGRPPRADSRSTRTAWCPSRTASKHVLSAGVVQVLQLGQRFRAQPVPAAWRLRWARRRLAAGEDVGAQFGVDPFGLVGALFRFTVPVKQVQPPKAISTSIDMSKLCM